MTIDNGIFYGHTFKSKDGRTFLKGVVCDTLGCDGWTVFYQLKDYNSDVCAWSNRPCQYTYITVNKRDVMLRLVVDDEVLYNRV